jgi:hypothetical protein
MSRPLTAEERVEAVLVCISGMTFDADGDDWARKVKPVITRAIRKAEQTERYNYDGAMSDLESLLKAVIARINGEKDMVSLAEYLRLNYPKQAAAIRSTEAPGRAEAKTYHVA